ncbi:hypothetical protein [Methylobacterium nonmethylotrophicum]|uniref:hypothetical protein n=1 Tax=Methylobacterium nonmethylotrophicum TaxID=1141884 RepID=UPI001436AD92|nr:hypothetical protein [Methylobacterium nonmethylotrophicum]
MSPAHANEDDPVRRPGIICHVVASIDETRRSAPRLLLEGGAGINGASLKQG